MSAKSARVRPVVMQSLAEFSPSLANVDRMADPSELATRPQLRAKPCWSNRFGNIASGAGSFNCGSMAKRLDAMPQLRFEADISHGKACTTESDWSSKRTGCQHIHKCEAAEIHGCTHYGHAEQPAQPDKPGNSRRRDHFRHPHGISKTEPFKAHRAAWSLRPGLQAAQAKSSLELLMLDKSGICGPNFGQCWKQQIPLSAKTRLIRAKACLRWNLWSTLGQPLDNFGARHVRRG